MSDEEKKEYEELKSLLYQGTISQYGKRKLIDTIEKQSKEIEELKQNIHLKEVYVLKTNDYIKGTNDADKLCNKKWEDKIKAKIEEVQDIRKHHLDEIKNIEVYNHTKQLWLKELDTKYIVLQSLLEKE